MNREMGGIFVDPKIAEQIKDSVNGFRLPRYHEIPDVGLYLEQVSKYIADSLRPLDDLAITGSMISNYVKRGLVSNPIKKQYNREQIAYLIYVAVVKTVLSMDDIRLTMLIQQRSYASSVAYNYFCDEFENILKYIFGIEDYAQDTSEATSAEKVMLRNTIITATHKIYLDKLFAALQKMEPEKNTGGSRK